jgi:hypothetical protein
MINQSLGGETVFVPEGQALSVALCFGAILLVVVLGFEERNHKERAAFFETMLCD